MGTRHQPHSVRSCVLWGRHEGAWGGRLLPGCGASGVGRFPTPDCPPSGRAAGAHYPSAVGAGGCGRGDLSPTPQRALLRAGFARCGGGMRVPGGAASCLGVGRPGSGALPPPTVRPLGGLPGPTTSWLWVRGGAGVGTRHLPHSARSCVSWGRHESAWGGRLLPGCGASGVGRSPTPDCPPSGRADGAHYPRLWVPGGCGRGDPSPTPQRVLLRARFARCGGDTRAPGGGTSCLGVGRSGSGALPSPTARPLGGLPGPTTHWLWVREGRAWGPITYPTARALACFGGGMRVPGGGASCLGVGRPGSGALPPPTLRPLGGLPGPTNHWLWVRGGAGVGTRHQPHSARSCELALRAAGAARGRPGGALPAWVWGVRGRALSRPRLPSLWAGCRGPLPTGVGAPCPAPRFVVCSARFPGSRHPVAVVAWHLTSCPGYGWRRASLACLVAPRWCAAPRPVRSLSLLRSAFPSPWCVPPPRGLSPPALQGGCAGHVEAGRESGSLCLPLAPADAGALQVLRVVPIQGPAMGLTLAGPSSFGLGLRALRWFGVCGPGH